MKQIKVKWNKVNPAELSATCCAQYFAFSKGQEILLISDVDKECLFTKVIQASANFNYSIYDIDIWVGYVYEGKEHFNGNLGSIDMMEILEWSANSQLQEEAGLNIVSKRMQLRQLAMA